MRKAIYNKSGMQQILDVPLKVFAKQTSALGTGNIWGGTQHSGFIRPYTQTECNGFTSPQGHLQEFDLQPFIDRRVPSYIIDFVREYAKDKYAIFYLFFHYNKGQRVLDGVEITDYDYNHVRTFYINRLYKAQETIDIARQYVANFA